MRILAIVVTYFPEKELLEKNISAFINDVDKVLIWENTPRSECWKYRFVKYDKAEYCGDGINSISHALNKAWHYALENGYDYLLTMDQDSVFDDFKTFKKLTIENLETHEGLWGANAYGEDVPSKIIVFDKIITSGMLIKVDLITLIGGWNEIFSIDCVDSDFCLNAKGKGVPSYVFGMCRLFQKYGTPKIVSMMGRSAIINYDSPKRLFSIYRNYVILRGIYPEEKCISYEFWHYWIPKIKWIVLCGDKPINNFFAIIKGLLSGFFYTIHFNKTMKNVQ